MIEDSEQEQSQQSWEFEEQTGCCDIVVGKRGGQLGELYLIPLDGRVMLKDELAQYQRRKDAHPQLVRVLSLQVLNGSGFCSEQTSIRLVTERIPFRLNEVDLNLKEALYVLHQCLAALRIVDIIVGPILVQQRMIGLDNQGKIKLWVNENYARNRPQNHNIIHGEREKSLGRMVQSLIEAIKTHNLPDDLVIELRRTNTPSMDDYVAIVQAHVDKAGINISLTKVLARKPDALEAPHQKGEEVAQTQSYNQGMQQSPPECMEGVPLPVQMLVHSLFKDPKFMSTMPITPVPLETQQAESEQPSWGPGHSPALVQQQKEQLKLPQSQTSKAIDLLTANLIRKDPSLQYDSHSQKQIQSLQAPQLIQALTPREYQRRLSLQQSQMDLQRIRQSYPYSNWMSQSIPVVHTDLGSQYRQYYQQNQITSNWHPVLVQGNQIPTQHSGYPAQYNYYRQPSQPAGLVRQNPVGFLGSRY